MIIVLILLAIIIGAIIYVPKIKRAMAFRESLDLKNIHDTFLHMDENLPIKKLSQSTTPFHFPREKEITLPLQFQYQEKTYNTSEYLDSSYTQGLLIIQDDSITYEKYWLGQKEDSPHISWSMAKSYVSALFGIAMEEGYIKSIDQTVDEYLPELKGSGYEGIKIKDVLQMSTGIKFDETYGDPKSDINRYWEGFVFGKSQDKFAATLVNERPPGTYNEYVSINTHVLGMIIVKATGRSLTDYLQDKIWSPLGSEHDAYWLADGQGMEMALGGLNATLRDYAKIGRLYLNKGNWNGKQIVPQSWVEESIVSTEEHLLPHSDKSLDPGLGYGYQWWLLDGNEKEFMAIGVFNQYIYVNPTMKTIIVKNSANKDYYDTENPHSQSLAHVELFRAIAHMSDKSE